MTSASVTATTTFTLRAENAAGDAVASATVRLGALFVDPVSGLDTAPGTRMQPLRTLLRASELALGGDTVYLLDGTHEIPFVNFADGVSLRAVNTGVPRVQLTPGNNGALIFAGSASVHGIHAGSAASFGFFQVSRSRFRLEEVQYTAPANGGYPLVFASGTAQVELIAPASGEWCPTACNTSFVSAREDATVLVVGGRIRNFTDPGALFLSGDRSALTLRDVVIGPGTASTVVALDNLGLVLNRARVRLERGTIRNALLNSTGIAVRFGSGSGSLVVDSSTIADNAGVGLDFYPSQDLGPDVQTATVTHSIISRNYIGLRQYLGSRARVVLRDVSLRGNTLHGIQCVFTVAGCGLDMEGGALSENGDRGLDTVNEGNKVNRVRLRGVEASR